MKYLTSVRVNLDTLFLGQVGYYTHSLMGRAGWMVIFRMPATSSTSIMLRIGPLRPPTKIIQTQEVKSFIKCSNLIMHRYSVPTTNIMRFLESYSVLARLGCVFYHAHRHMFQPGYIYVLCQLTLPSFNLRTHHSQRCGTLRHRALNYYNYTSVDVLAASQPTTFSLRGTDHISINL